MNSKTSPAASMFEKVLRAFETRGITYSDVLARLRRLLATGASPTELLAVLKRRESTERLPEYSRVEALLLEAIQRAAPRDAVSVPVPAPADARLAAPSPVSESPDDEVAVDLDFDVAGGESSSQTRMRASELDLSVLAKRLRSIDERVPARGAALEALTRSYERAREAESSAAQRATTLGADLEAAQDALELEQGKLREIEQALAARDTALDQTRQVLDERDARIAALAGERAQLEAALEARARAAAELEAELRAARAHAEAAAAELRASRQAAAALDAELQRTAARTERAAPRTDREDSPAQPHRDAEPPEPPTPRHQGVSAAALGWAAGAVLLAAFAWLFLHRSPAPPAPVVAAAPNPGAVIRDCAQCPAMTVLPTGRFKQGSAGAPAFEQPQHWVAIGRSIAMSTNPVTLEDFGQFVTATGRDMQGCDTYDGGWKHRADDSWERPGFAQTGAHPVTCVSWNDADAYAKWLSAKTGHRYRLPSASEWEYAARAGADGADPWGPGGHDACAEANVADASAGRRFPGWTVFPCDDGYVFTSPVGAFKANSFGLNDMLGNVLQWTGDCWNENYAGAPVDGSARADGDCSQHEIRGGSWFSAPAYVRADYRDRFPADYRTSSVGIRLVRELGP